VAAGDNCRGLPDQVLGAHLVGLASNCAIPEEQLTEKEDEGACSTHQVPGRGKQEKQHDSDDEEHSENLREESALKQAGVGPRDGRDGRLANRARAAAGGA
jgi:hypothetical protein